jgi:hypothetical protein
MYHSFKELHIELYTDEKTPDTEQRVEEVLLQHNIYYTKSEVDDKITNIPIPDVNENSLKLAADLYTYVPIGKAQKASNETIGSGLAISATNPGKLGSAGDSLKSVFNQIFGEQTDVQPTITTSNVKLNVSPGTTAKGGGEYGTAVADRPETISFTLANKGTAGYGYRCGDVKTTGSQSFYYPVTKQSDGQNEADIKITLPTNITKVEDTTITSVAYKKLTTAYNSNTVTMVIPTNNYISCSNNTLYCNFNNSKQVIIEISLPAGSVTTSVQTLYEQIKGEVILGAAQKEDQLTAGTAITKFLTYLKNDATETAKLSGGTKSNTAGAYTISAGSYSPYFLASTSNSLTSVAKDVATKFTYSDEGVSIDCTTDSYIWFLMVPGTSGDKTIQYEALGQWYDFNGGTTGPVDVSLTLDSGATVTYKGYYTNKQASAGTTKFKIINKGD